MHRRAGRRKKVGVGSAELFLSSIASPEEKQEA
jgi:hypothetical protein